MGGSVLQGLLLIIALIAIFDTQVLSIFRRQKEIGTYIALGMTRAQVVGIFTVEGGAHSILAILLGAAYGIPLLLLLNKNGIGMAYAEDMAFDIPVAEAIFPYYSFRDPDDHYDRGSNCHHSELSPCQENIKNETN